MNISVGLIFGLLVFLALALWGLASFRHRVKERPSEASSHHESGQGGINVPKSLR